MKIVLRQDVPNLGGAGSIVNAADAFVRNYLLPAGLAQPASPRHIADAAGRQKKDQANRARQAERWQQARARLAGRALHVRGRANDQGKLFAALRTQDLIVAGQALGVNLSGCTFNPDHLKTIGVHTVAVHWPDGQTGHITVHVDRA